MKSKLLVIYLIISVIFLSLGCGKEQSGNLKLEKMEETTENTKIRQLEETVSSLESINIELQNNNEKQSEKLTDKDIEVSDLKTEVSDLNTEVSSLNETIESLQLKYDDYKEKMEPFEGLEEAEAESRKIEADRIIQESIQAEEAAREAEEQAKAEKEKQGYETGITFEQLARTPDDYKDEKVKFTGTVLQVLDDDFIGNIRLAVNGDYNQVILLTYFPSIVSQRILEDDNITIYGTSDGITSYESTIGKTISLPSVFVTTIDFN